MALKDFHVDYYHEALPFTTKTNALRQNILGWTEEHTGAPKGKAVVAGFENNKNFNYRDHQAAHSVLNKRMERMKAKPAYFPQDKIQHAKDMQSLNEQIDKHKEAYQKLSGGLTKAVKLFKARKVYLD